MDVSSPDPGIEAYMERKKNKPYRSDGKCSSEHCSRICHADNSFCILHLPEEIKDTLELWEETNNFLREEIRSGESEFKGMIVKDLDLSNSTYSQRLDFSHTSYLGSFLCTGSVFKLPFIAKDSIFQCPSDFSDSEFRSDVNFSDSTFNEIARFRHTRFLGNSSFKRISFTHANFHDATFALKCNFSPKHEDQTDQKPTFLIADFTGAQFEGGGSFDRCIMPNGDFQDSSILNLSFREVNLDRVRFAGALMESTYLSDSEWTVEIDRKQYKSLHDFLTVYDPRLIIREELEAKQLPDEEFEEKGEAYKKAESTYRRIKHSLANEGDYEKAGEFYIHEMRMKRMRYQCSIGFLAKWNYFWNILYSWTCGYGERPKRVFLNALLMIIVFTLLYYAGSGISKDDDESYDPSLKECLYFSVVTFTTLGYGDYAPKSGFQLIAVFEAFFGAFTIALFVLVFGRKVMR